MKKTLRENILEARTEKGILQEEIAKFFKKRQSNISYIEGTINSNTFVRYLWFLRKKGIDLNKIFDNSCLLENKKETPLKKEDNK